MVGVKPNAGQVLPADGWPHIYLCVNMEWSLCQCMGNLIVFLNGTLTLPLELITFLELLNEVIVTSIAGNLNRHLLSKRHHLSDYKPRNHYLITKSLN